jgi:hypothetical protein
MFRLHFYFGSCANPLEIARAINTITSDAAFTDVFTIFSSFFPHIPSVHELRTHPLSSLAPTRTGPEHHEGLLVARCGEDELPIGL